MSVRRSLSSLGSGEKHVPVTSLHQPGLQGLQGWVQAPLQVPITPLSHQAVLQCPPKSPNALLPPLPLGCSLYQGERSLPRVWNFYWNSLNCGSQPKLRNPCRGKKLPGLCVESVIILF